MNNTSRQKIEYLENEKSSLDGKKSIFHHFLRAIIEENKKKKLESDSPISRNLLQAIKSLHMFYQSYYTTDVFCKIFLCKFTCYNITKPSLCLYVL